MTQGVLRSLKLAMDIWEEKLNIFAPIAFYVIPSEEMDDDMATSTTVLYDLSEGKSIPRSLLVQSYDISSVGKDTIRINAFANWGIFCLCDDVYAGTYSLTTYFLRHIAHILGFGSSVVDRNGMFHVHYYHLTACWTKMDCTYKGREYTYLLFLEPRPPDRKCHLQQQAFPWQRILWI